MINRLTTGLLDELGGAAGKAPYQGRWFVEENKTSAWVGTPKGMSPFEKCDDVFFGQDLTGYKPEYVERTLALYRFIALANPSTVAAMVEDLLELRRRLAQIADEARQANAVIALNRDGGGQGRVRVATAMHRIEKTALTALTQEKT